MFNAYFQKRTTRAPRWSHALIAISIALHIGAGCFVLYYSWFKIELLEVPRPDIAVGFRGPLAHPPATPRGWPHLEPRRVTTATMLKAATVPRARRPKKFAAPAKPDPSAATTPPPASDLDRVAEAEIEGGIAGAPGPGGHDDLIAAVVELVPVRTGREREVTAPRRPAAPAAPPARSASYRTVSPQLLERERIAGERNIVPDDATKARISQSGQNRLVVPVNLCVSATGAVEAAEVVKPSGFAEYDVKIRRSIHAWKFRPFSIGGQPTAVCATITLIYLQNYPRRAAG